MNSQQPSGRNKDFGVKTSRAVPQDPYEPGINYGDFSVDNLTNRLIYTRKQEMATADFKKEA